MTIRLVMAMLNMLGAVVCLGIMTWAAANAQPTAAMCNGFLMLFSVINFWGMMWTIRT